MEISLFESIPTDFTAQQASQKTEAPASAEFASIIDGLITEAAPVVKTGAETCDNTEAKTSEMMQTVLLNAPSVNVEAAAVDVSGEDAIENIAAPTIAPADELLTEAEGEDTEVVEVDADNEKTAAPVYVQPMAAVHVALQAQTIQPPAVNNEDEEAPVQEVTSEPGKVSQADKEVNGANITKEKPVAEPKTVEQKAAVEPQSFNKEVNKETRAERAEVKTEKREDAAEDKAVLNAREKVEASEPEKNTIDLSPLKEGLVKEETPNDGNRNPEKHENHEKKETFVIKEKAASESNEIGGEEIKENAEKNVEAFSFVSPERETGTEAPAVNSGSERLEVKELSGVHSASHAKEAAHTKAAQEPSTNSNPVQHAKEVYEKFGEGVKMSLADSGKEVRMSLHPEDLGHLQIKLKVEDNLVKAHILVDSAAVKSVFDTDSIRLKEVFAAQGLTLDKCSVELNMNSNRFENNSANGSSWDGHFGGGKREHSSSFWHKEEAKELRQYAQNYNCRKGQGGVDIFA